MRQASMEDAPPIEDEDEEPTSEHVDGLELIFGRGRSGYKDVYPHRKGWQAKVFVEDKGACSLGIFKDKKQAAIAVARAKAAGLYLLPSPDKTRAKPGCGSAQNSRALLANPFHVFSQALLLDSCCTVKRKYPSTPANLPTFSMASLENSSSQLATVPARPLGSVACMQACMAGVPAMLAQPVAAPAPTQPTEQRHLSLLPDGGCLRGR